MSDFAEMALALTLAADKMQLDLGQTELIASRIGLSQAAVAIVVTEREADIRRVLEARELLKSLLNSEPDVRKLANRIKPRLAFTARKIAAGLF